MNTSYKRAALAAIDDFDGLGTMDVVHEHALGRSGATIRFRWRSLARI